MILNAAERVPFDLPALLEEVARDAADQASSGDPEIVSSVDPSTPAIVRGDPALLRQLAAKLLGYAVVHADRPGEVSIHSRMEKELESVSVVHFSIFYTSINGHVAGQETDSELDLSKQLLKQLGGVLLSEPHPEKATRIAFTVGFERETSLPPIEPVVEFKGLRVLLVDDNPASRQCLTILLNSMGCRVKAVAGGEQALPALVRGMIMNAPYRVVLADLDMPGLNGSEVLRAIRQDDQTKNTKVILLVPAARPELLKDIPKSDYSSTIIKPVQRAEVRQALRDALGLQPAPREMSSAGGDDQAAEGRTAQPIRVLLVDDDELNQKIGSLLLKNQGCVVDTASSGFEAVAALHAQDYDIVFMDLQMPDMDGMEATRRIRALRNRRQNVPIIAMTASWTGRYQERCLQAGMDDYISKPFDVKRIGQILAFCAAGEYRKKHKPVTEGGPSIGNQVLDVEMALPIFNNNLAQYQQFLTEFLEGYPRRYQEMAAALDVGNWDLLGNEAHKLRGITANLGAMKVASLAFLLDTQSKEQNRENARSTLQQIEEAVKDLAEQASHKMAVLGKTGNNEPIEETK